MAKSKCRVEPLGTIWNCPDDLWDVITPVLDELDPPHKGHRPALSPTRRPGRDHLSRS